MMSTIRGTVILLTICCSTGIYGHAQVTRSSDAINNNTQRTYTPIKPAKPKAISHEVSGGLRLNTDGLSIFADIGRMKPRDAKHADMFYNLRFWQIEFTNKRNPKEFRVSGQGGSTSNSYIYGKINNFYALKLGRGYARMIAGKPDPGSVSIHWIYAGGVSIGFLKPYYLNVYSDPTAIKYNDNTKQDFLNQTVIEGSAGFGKGLSEIKVNPGVHLKTALHFDFSANRKTVLGVETGVNFEYYSQQVQILANQPATPYFVDLYVGLQIGKRW